MFKKEDEFVPGTAAIPTSTVEITISCRKLKNKDLLSKSDPFCVAYHQPPGANHFVELLRTETIQNNLNPDFAAKPITEYYFEERQMMRFEIYDEDKPSIDLSKHDFIGSADCSIAQIVSAGPEGCILPLNSGNLIDGDKPVGNIILTAEELASLKDEATIRLSGCNMGVKGCFFFQPTIYFVVSRLNVLGNYVVVHRSPSAKGQSPEWQSFTCPLRRLCNGDKELGLKIEVFQELTLRSAKSLGFCLTNLKELQSNGTCGLVLSTNSGKKTSATIIVLLCKISPIYTFLDYIQNGTQIHCCISVDFTSSNGDPKDPRSLHYWTEDPEAPNPYEQAIMSVGRIIEDYASDKLFPVYGFGAKIPPNMQVSHNFFITLTDSGYCYGIPGVLENYKGCLARIELYAPTNFAPVINHVTELATNHQNGNHYFVLLIITDGVITDMPATKEAIVNASVLPISVIIVGVGNEDFTAMEELDGDSVRISYKGRMAARDIVQFVPYRNAHSWLQCSVGKSIRERVAPPSPPGPVGGLNPKDRQHAVQQKKQQLHESITVMAQDRLAQEVLAEIPEQLTSFMKSKGLIPSNIKREFFKPIGGGIIGNQNDTNNSNNTNSTTTNGT